MKTELKIPLIARKVFPRKPGTEELQQLINGLAAPENRMPEIVGALINVHKNNVHDTREIREKFGDMHVELAQVNGNINLHCKKVPMDCLYDGRHVIWQSIEHISAVIRDLIFAPEFPKGPEACRSSYIKKFVENSGLMYRGVRGLVMFTWGGHQVPMEEYSFAKELGYWTALFMPDMENITGCGVGIMKAPFKGAQVAYGKQNTFERYGMRDFIGFSEKKILAAEAPNELVTQLLTFPTIEERMEAFIRASHRGKVHPGGAGTIEEILTMLALLSMPENKEIPYSFDLVEKGGGIYFKELVEYLNVCFGNELDGLYNVHVGTARAYANYLAYETEKLSTKFLWNDDLVFDHRIQKPFAVTFESMEALDLSRNQEPFSLLINLRRFFSAVVHLSVKDPDMLDSWGDDRPLIKGDKKIVQATDQFVQKLAQQGRIHPSKNKTASYRIE
ncbi:PpnN family nucleotide 5'-monophosphate nucleosidase [Maridesulfovibrio zosterae]|uniref:PpnN family nucleotide 5'-monophosphate nucleosidase n=1 Tax=Maridesulfovibrio zosterae TaxID=82171 RepID=UPI0004028249|nr:PpnN family nucleotide 5'-monophosphate nucleosidase [Maridesulfovibrio zosterae]